MSLDSEEALQHYLNHAELEMAVELFCLDLIKSKCVPSVQNKQKLLDLVKDLDLLNNSVFDPEFGDKFRRFAQSEN